MNNINKDKLNEALAGEMNDLWHNATLHSTIRIADDDLGEYVNERLNQYNRFEIDYMQSEFGGMPYSYFLDKLRDKKCSEFSLYNACYKIARGQYNRQHTPATLAITNLIDEYGELYQYGRYGSSLAPEKLITPREGINDGIIDKLNAEKKTELLYNLRHFNQYVRNYCSSKNQDKIIDNILYERIEELQDKNAELKAELAKLKPELRAQRLQPTVCAIVKDKIRSVFADFQNNMREIILIKQTIGE